MRIAIDIDDTITNTYDVLMGEIALHFGMDEDLVRGLGLSYYDFTDNKKMFPDYDSFATNNFERILYNVPIKEYVLEVLNKLHDEGYEIWVLTARNEREYHDPYKFTEDFLIRNNIPFDRIITSTKGKGEICKENDICLLIDDSVRNCINAYENGVRCLLFDNVFNKKENRFERVYDWKEVYDIIKRDIN